MLAETVLADLPPGLGRPGLGRPGFRGPDVRVGVVDRDVAPVVPRTGLLAGALVLQRADVAPGVRARVSDLLRREDRGRGGELPDVPWAALLSNATCLRRHHLFSAASLVYYG